ncbi:PREDICTED: uncharacterized protein LOC106727965 [Myotis brandtii]|uniref:uncharacterized protein LOC106727965 n=1 Tax=Myotis brandtii TaxID=109478 RepID=UPI0007044DF7|nr:PREDICTED: uncharacterized protein LOC106727965 [Myotis brandtii]
MDVDNMMLSRQSQEPYDFTHMGQMKLKAQNEHTRQSNKTSQRLESMELTEDSQRHGDKILKILENLQEKFAETKSSYEAWKKEGSKAGRQAAALGSVKVAGDAVGKISLFENVLKDYRTTTAVPAAAVKGGAGHPFLRGQGSCCVAAGKEEGVEGLKPKPPQPPERFAMPKLVSSCSPGCVWLGAKWPRVRDGKGTGKQG